MAKNTTMQWGLVLLRGDGPAPYFDVYTADRGNSHAGTDRRARTLASAFGNCEQGYHMLVLVEVEGSPDSHSYRPLSRLIAAVNARINQYIDDPDVR